MRVRYAHPSHTATPAQRASAPFSCGRTQRAHLRASSTGIYTRSKQHTTNHTFCVHIVKEAYLWRSFCRLALITRVLFYAVVRWRAGGFQSDSFPASSQPQASSSSSSENDSCATYHRNIQIKLIRSPYVPGYVPIQPYNTDAVRIYTYINKPTPNTMRLRLTDK